MTYFSRVLASVLLLLINGIAFATPVKWELVNVKLTSFDFETTQISGSFVYDADLPLGQRYSNVNITGSWLGNYSSGQSYGLDGQSSDTTGFFFINEDYPVYLPDYTGSFLFLSYATELTNEGGVVDLIPGGQNGDSFEGPGEIICDSGEGCLEGISPPYNFTVVNDGPPSYTTNGYLVGTVVPIPAAVWLFGSALAAIGFLRKQ